MIFNLFKKKKEVPIDKLLFKISIPIKILELPEITDLTIIDIKYPLIEPYAYAHIFFDHENNELVYFLEEPSLNEKEKELLKILEDNLRELINISFVNIKDNKTVIEYLEKNIKISLKEMGIKLSTDNFLKFMYYIYRDFIGLNEIEPLMQDYYIEDIQCNGWNTPLYLVHRKYRNLRTNIVYKDNKKLVDFVEKLAQKCSKYVSYANPLLNGRLPDGSRVNATYTEDISSRGPTFTIRKFTKEPWTPIKLIDFRTVSPEILAYLWLLIEYESNIIIIGGTGSGKCVVGDTPIHLANGKIIKIKELVESKFSKNNIIKNNGWEYTFGDGTSVLSLNKSSLKIDEKPITKFWRHKAPKRLIKVATRSGRSIVTTPEHPFFTCIDGNLSKIRADKLKINERIAAPRILPIKNEINNDLLINYLKDEKGIYVYKEFNKVNQISRLLCKKYNCKIEELTRKFGYNSKTFREWHHKNAIPLKEYFYLIEKAGLCLDDNIKLKAKTLLKPCKLPKLNPELFRFIALIISDGHLTKNYVEFHNSDRTLLNEFLKLSKDLFGLDGKIKSYKNRTPKTIIHSSVLTKILNKIFQVPYGNKARKVVIPDILLKQDNNYISEFISGVVDCEGYIGKEYIEISSASEKFTKGLSTLLLRLGILPIFIKKKDHYRINLYCYDNINKFKSLINIKKPDKVIKLNKLLSRNLMHKTVNLDIVPNLSSLIKKIRLNSGLTQENFAQGVNVSRRLIGLWESGLRNPTMTTFNQFADFVEIPRLKTLSDSDIYWDNVIEIKELRNHNEKYVYDLTVDIDHNFIAGEIPIITHNTTFLNSIAFFIPPSARIVSIEETKELNLMHENWLPSVAREGIGLANVVGQKYGEITLFDLLRESFRQRPDYVIVGEIRGREAYVLFQGASSGHPSYCTMHAESVESMVRRLESPPIELSPSLIEALDVVCTIIETKVDGKPVRRLKEIVEILKMEESGKMLTNIPFTRDPKTDKFYFKTDSKIFEKITNQFGISKQALMDEFSNRTKLLMKIYQNRIFGFKEVQNIINAYYKDPKNTLKKFSTI